MGCHTAGVTQVVWGGQGLIYSAARYASLSLSHSLSLSLTLSLTHSLTHSLCLPRDCTINVWRAADGVLVRYVMAGYFLG